MKRMCAQVAALALMAVFALGGCVAKGLKPNATMPFDVPSRLSVIKDGSGVKLISYEKTGFPGSSLVRELSKQLNDAGKFRVNQGNYKYVMSVSVFMDSRFDTKQQGDYNLKVGVVQRTSDDGSGHDELVSSTALSSQASLVATVSIYELSNLTPLAYFNVISSSCEWKKDGKLLCRADYEKMLAEKIVARIRNLIVRERRDVGVIVPASGSGQAKLFLMDGKPQEALNVLEPLLPPAPVTQLNAKLYEKWAKEAETAKANGQEVAPRNMKEDLGNIYLYLLARESAATTPSVLTELHDGYTRVLYLADDKDLIDACAHSLGRVEENARRLNIVLLTDETD